MPNIYFHTRHSHFDKDTWMKQTSVCWGKKGSRSTLIAVIHIAYLLGFRRMYLLGCDFHMDEDTKYFFPQERTEGAINHNNKLYEGVSGHLEEIRPVMERAGFYVYNCTPDSKLTVFPYKDFNEAIRENTISLATSTEGMYVNKKKKKAMA